MRCCERGVFCDDVHRGFVACISLLIPSWDKATSRVWGFWTCCHLLAELEIFSDTLLAILQCFLYRVQLLNDQSCHGNHVRMLFFRLFCHSIYIFYRPHIRLFILQLVVTYTYPRLFCNLRLHGATFFWLSSCVSFFFLLLYVYTFWWFCCLLCDKVHNTVYVHLFLFFFFF